MAKKKPAADRADAPRSRTLTDVEWAIMNVVWEKEPCAAGTVQETLSEAHGWAYSTVKTTMDRMVAKGLLSLQTIRNLNLFSSQITRKEARRGELRRLLKQAFGGALSPMLQFLIDDEALSEEELQELRAVVNRTKHPKS
jgi:BlaI family transcriptional regulator, penicillinase repressor